MQRLLLSVALTGFVAAPAFAQQTTIQYDDVAQDVDAAITCGFCAMEKFGTIFYELPGGGGLPGECRGRAARGPLPGGPRGAPPPDPLRSSRGLRRWQPELPEASSEPWPARPGRGVRKAGRGVVEGVLRG